MWWHRSGAGHVTLPIVGLPWPGLDHGVTVRTRAFAEHTVMMPPRAIDHDAAYAALLRRDTTFDGTFIAAVRTTGIYCRASCPARKPLRTNVTFFATAQEARASGFRACLRCRPDEATSA